MKARLAFSVAIHSNRDILLMDEVLAVGDIAFKDKCYDVFCYFKENGRTIILVTHGMNTVNEFCDRALILDQSRIVNSGDPGQIVDEYKTLFHIKGTSHNKSGQNAGPIFDSRRCGLPYGARQEP